MTDDLEGGFADYAKGFQNPPAGEHSGRQIIISEPAIVAAGDKVTAQINQIILEAWS